MRARTLVGGLVVVLGGCPVGPRRQVIEPAPEVVSVPAAPAVALKPVLEVVYEDDWDGLTRIMGIDGAAGVAYLWRTSASPRRSVVDAIDLATGERVQRWRPNDGMGHYAWERTGAFASEASTVARMLARTLPRHTRNDPVATPITVSPNGRRFLYTGRPTDGKDGDWLYLADAAGTRVGRIDAGLRASYTPVFSPDSRRVAWRGYSAKHGRYRLWLSELGGRPRFVHGTDGARLPVFSADGQYVYTVTRKKVGTERHPAFGGRRDVFRQCLTRVRAIGEAAPASLGCIESYHDAHFVQAASGESGAFVVQRGESGQHAFEYTWLTLPAGEPIARHQVERPFQAGVLGERGVLVTEASRGLVAVSLRSGRTEVLMPRTEFDQFRLDGTAFRAGGDLVVARGHRSRWTVAVVRPKQALE